MTLSRSLSAVRTGTSAGQPLVTVIIAARNEQKTIASCLAALKSQDYPPDRFEVVVADDRSFDDTPGILERFALEWKRLIVIHIDSCKPGLSPKKNALRQAIEHAHGEIILQTDADCVVPVGWISGMVKRFEPGIDMVAGVAPYRTGKGILGSFIRHEYIWNIFLSAGSIALGAGTHASGRNLGFRRSAFEAINGYGDTEKIQSGDDTLLLQRLQRMNRSGVATNPDSQTHVYTSPPPAFSSFFKQRVRHMSTGRYFHPFQILAGVLVYGFHIGILASFLIGIFQPKLLFIAVGFLIMKFLIDAIAYRKVRKVFNLPVEWNMFPIHELFLVAYLALFPLLGAVVPVHWKENN